MRVESLICAATLACGCATAPPGPLMIDATRPLSPTATVLAARAPWGKDFPALLVHLRAWNRVGEQSIVIFADRVVGAKAYRTEEELKPKVEALSRAMAERPAPVPPFSELLRGVQTVPFQASVIRLPDDASYRLAWTGSRLEFLAKDLTIKTVQKTLGPPESVKRESVPEPEGGEKRPVILTLHRYSRGAVVFAERDWARPGAVDRVILDIALAAEAVFGGTP